MSPVPDLPSTEDDQSERREEERRETAAREETAQKESIFSEKDSEMMIFESA